MELARALPGGVAAWTGAGDELTWHPHVPPGGEDWDLSWLERVLFTTPALPRDRDRARPGGPGLPGQGRRPPPAASFRDARHPASIGRSPESGLGRHRLQRGQSLRDVHLRAVGNLRRRARSFSADHSHGPGPPAEYRQDRISTGHFARGRSGYCLQEAGGLLRGGPGTPPRPSYCRPVVKRGRQQPSPEPASERGGGRPRQHSTGDDQAMTESRPDPAARFSGRHAGRPPGGRYGREPAH